MKKAIEKFAKRKTTDGIANPIIEEKLLKANRLYLFISQVNQLIVRAKDEMTVFSEVCKIAVRVGKFKMAWIGLINEETKILQPLLHEGVDEEYLSSIKIIADKDRPEGNGPAGIAMAQGRYVFCNDIETDPLMQFWRKEALARGYRSSISLPVKKSGKVIGAFTLYADTKNFFNAEEIALLEETTNDISFALEFFAKEALRKVADEALFKSERRYYTLTEISPVGIFHTDANGYTTYVNPKWCEISGLSAEKALGNGWFSAVHPEDRPLLIDGWTMATKEQQLSISEYRFLRPDGNIAWVLGQAIPERNAKNEIIGYVGTTTDITERKKGEMEIARLYNEKRTILNRINDGMVSLDTEWRYTFLNDAAMATHPLPRAEIIGKTIWDIHPDLAGTRFAEVYHTAMQTKKVQEVEDYYPQMNIWFSVKVYPASDGLTIFYTNINERKKIEAEVQLEQHLSDSIINSLPGVFYLYTKEGKFLRWNKNFENVSGYNSDEISKMHPVDFVAETDKELLALKIAATFTKGEAELQTDFFTKSKKKIPYYFTGIAIEYKNETCLMGVGIDFSERVRIQNEIRKTSYQLQQLTMHLHSIREEERKRIAREIHDELGQQLTAIKMDIAWINKKSVNTETAVKEKLHNVIQLLDGSNLAIRRILNELRPAVLDEYGLMDALQWHTRQFMESTGIKAELITEKKTLKIGEQIATCIYRVYQEALTNIARHASATKVITTIHCNDTTIEVVIEDNGCGFDDALVDVAKSFGLLGMRERIRALQGSFGITSQIGSGTRINISLPMQVAQKTDML